ncbi:MAG TPA: PH domain-containing protein [Jatrophihabitantaceae bacterium]
MPYPETILADDERVVAHLHPHWITLVPATFWFLIICGAAGVAIAYLPSGSAHTPLLIGILAVGFLLLYRLTFVPWISWRTTHYVFTTHRVLIRRGVLRHVGHDISLQRINDVGFSQSLRDRIVRAGTITIESAGEQGQETPHNIPRAVQLQQMLNGPIEEDADRRAREAYGDPAQYQGPPGSPPRHHPHQRYPPEL